MKIESHFFTYIILMIFFSFSLFAQENQIFKVITPYQTDVNDEKTAYIVVEAQGGVVDSFKVATDANETFSTDVNSTRTHYCKTIPLHLGENSITIDGYRQGHIVREEKLDVYVVSKVYKEYKYPPKKYAYNFFHNESNEKVCAKCHDMSVNEIKGVAFVDVTESNCYQCHNSSIGERKHAHAPSVNWLCTSCHNGEVGIYNSIDANKSKFTVPDPIESICFSCHKKNKEKWSKRRFKHEPADSGRCNKCHNPHGSDNLNYLRKPVWKLCTSCHKDKIKGMHIVKTFSRVMHPTHGVEDPSRKDKEKRRKSENPLKQARVLTKKDKELSCVSCHNPHASNSSSLLQSESIMSLCSRCHKK